MARGRAYGSARSRNCITNGQSAMKLTVTYEGTVYAVHLATLPDGWMRAHDSAHLAAYCAATLAPGDVERDFSPMYEGPPEAAEARVLLLNVAINMCLEEGRLGGWKNPDGTIRGYPWASWADVPREDTERILRAAMNLSDAEADSIAEMAEFYASEDDEHRRIYRFRNPIDRVFWRFCQASASLAEAHELWRSHSQHAVEHYLILKNLMGEKPDGTDADL
jgi:hypothetical protein